MFVGKFHSQFTIFLFQETKGILLKCSGNNFLKCWKIFSVSRGHFWEKYIKDWIKESSSTCWILRNKQQLSDWPRSLPWGLVVKYITVCNLCSDYPLFPLKHHLNNEGISSPALRRSQLAVALSKREIPATEAPNDPITDIGAPVPTLRPPSQQKTERYEFLQV